MKPIHALVPLMMCFSAGAAIANVITLDVFANIDGRDSLIIAGSSLTWQHFDNTPVGLHNGSYPSTILTTTLDGVVDLDNYAWTPDWPGGTGYGAYSSTFSVLSPAIPLQDMDVSLVVEQGRGSLSIVQLPSAGNGYTTIIEFNDNSYGSDANYQGKLTFTTIPEPGSFMLAMAGLGLMGFVARRRRPVL